MNWEFNFYNLPLWIASLVSLALAQYTWRFRNHPGAKPFTLLMLAVSIWDLGYGFEIAAPGLALKILWAKIQYLGIVSVPLFWLVFTLFFSGNSSWLTPRLQRLLPVFPLMTLMLAWTNERHGLIWREIQIHNDGSFHDLSITYGTWFWFNIAYSYLLLLAGSVLLVRFYLQSRNLFRQQARALLLATIFPWLGNAIYLSGWNPVPDLDLTPFAFTLSGLIIAWGVFRLQFLDIVPLARHRVVESLNDGVFVLDRWNRIIDINPAGQALLSENTDMVGLPAAYIFREYPGLIEQFRDVQEAREVLNMHCRGQEIFYEMRISPILDAQSKNTGRLIVLHDITEREQARRILQQAQQLLEDQVQQRTIELEAANQKLQVEIAERRSAEEALLYQSMHDVLTGLPNRRMFINHLENAFERARRNKGASFAVLFMDLDRFKEINDSLGHVAGDQLLIAIAQRLQRSLRTMDTLARFGGDEFALLVEEIKNEQEPVLVAQRILHELSQPFLMGGQEVFTTASIGIALVSKKYRHPEEVLRDADVAMYWSKEHGRGGFHVFSPETPR